MADAELRRAVERLAAELARTQEQVRTLQRGQRRPQLSHSAMTGSIDVIDEETEEVRLRIGRQPDGTIGLVAEGGDAPPAPSAPVVEPSLAGLRVSWDGEMANELAVPADMAHVEVHVSTSPGFAASAATRVGTITQAGAGGMLPVVPLPYTEHYVRLVGVNTSGVSGSASAETAGTPLQVDGPDLTAGSVTAGAIAAGAVEADKLAGLIVLASRLVAGDPSGARVELNSEGFRAYTDTEELTVQIDAATGSAVFTGVILGSEIEGGSLLIEDGEGNSVAIDAQVDNVSLEALSVQGSRLRVEAGDPHAWITIEPIPQGGRTWDPGTLQSQVVEVDTDEYVPAVALYSPREGTHDSAIIELDGGSDDQSTPFIFMVSTATTNYGTHIVGDSTSPGFTATSAAVGPSVVGTSTGYNAFRTRDGGDPTYRYLVTSGGTIWLGNGTDSLDTNLYRSAANVLRTDDSLTVGGDLTVLGDPLPGTVVAQLRQTSAQSIPTSTQTPLEWDTADIDTLSGWSAGSNPSRYTPTVAGRYLIMGRATFVGASGGIRESRIWRNGANVNGSSMNVAPSGASDRLAPVPVVVELDGSSDYVEVVANQTSGGNVDTFTTSVGQPIVTVTYVGPL